MHFEHLALAFFILVDFSILLHGPKQNLDTRLWFAVFLRWLFWQAAASS